LILCLFAIPQVLADRPEAADQYEFRVEDGDVILLATDGIFDNVPDRMLVEEMDKVQHCKDELVLQQCANTIALMARRLSRDSKVMLGFYVALHTISMMPVYMFPVA
jgi:protein phosphatase PTC7